VDRVEQVKLGDVLWRGVVPRMHLGEQASPLTALPETLVEVAFHRITNPLFGPSAGK